MLNGFIFKGFSHERKVFTVNGLSPNIIGVGMEDRKLVKCLLPKGILRMP